VCREGSGEGRGGEGRGEDTGWVGVRDTEGLGRNIRSGFTEGKGSGGKGLRIMESEWLDGVNRGSMRACSDACRG